VPSGGYDSEHLLASRELNAVRGQRILLIRGGAGRPLLAEQLRERGADVQVLDVYERRRATPPPGAIEAVEQAWRSGAIQIVTATSVDIARALVEMLSPAGRLLLASTPLLVGSKRIAETLQQMGLQGPMVVAASPHDDELIAALLATPKPRHQPNASA
jgi:uroporphyrinogen-III synthase